MAASALDTIEQSLEAGEVVVMDGATGTELERRGAATHEGAWCAMAIVTEPELLRTVHEDYIRAGARVITTNTFSTNRIMLEPAGLGLRFRELNREAVRLALEARQRTGMEGRVAVAGSMSHQVPFHGGTDQRDPHSIPSPDIAEAYFREMAELLAESGVDLLLMEMMSDPDLANPAIRAAVATGLPVWVGFSVTAGRSGAPVAYTRPELTVDELLEQVPIGGVAAAGVMHSKAHTVAPAIERIKAHWSGPLMAYPDSGYFTMPHWNFVDIIPVQDFVAHSRDWAAHGVQLIGGCCGLGVEHIRGLADSL